MRNKGNRWIIMGLLLIAAALFLTAYNFYDQHRAGQTAGDAADILENIIQQASDSNEDGDTAENETEAETPDYIINPDMEMPIKSIDGIDYIGILYIPSLELKLPVISDWDYEHLKIAPARYRGSAYQDNLIICAHNYTTHFGKLKQLNQGDEIYFIDIDGNEFSYTVMEVEILMPGDIEEMESGNWNLTLFTCTMGGQSRVTVRCERK